MALNKGAFARAVLRLYPRSWRQRYEDEVLALLEARELTVTALADLALGATRERLHQFVGWRPSELGRLQLEALVGFVGLWLAGGGLALAGSALGRALAQHGTTAPTTQMPFAFLQLFLVFRAIFATILAKDSRWSAVSLAEIAFWLGLIFVGNVFGSMPYGASGHAMYAGEPLWATAVRGGIVVMVANGTPRHRSRTFQMERLRADARKARREAYETSILGLNQDREPR